MSPGYNIENNIESYLECEMFQEMGSAICSVGLGTGASIDPHTNCRCLRPRRVFCSDLSCLSKIRILPMLLALTVKPLDNVVVSVLTPFLLITGVAKPLFSGDTALREARLRSPRERFKANRRDAMGTVY